METTTLFWDVGGVLFSEAQISRPEFRPVLELLGMEPEQSDILFNDLWERGVRLGSIDEDTYWDEYIRQATKNPTVAEIKQLYRSCIRVNQPVFDMVAILSSRLDQFIISNHGREWMDYLIEHWNLDSYFKDIFCSAHMGVGKPDPKFYDIALERSGKNPAEIVYIDDNETNLLVAQSKGIRGILYQGYLEEGIQSLTQALSPLL